MWCGHSLSEAEDAILQKTQTQNTQLLILVFANKIHKFSSVYPIHIQVKHIQYVHTICANIVCTCFSNTWKHNLFLLVLMFWGQTGSPSLSTKQKLVREDNTWQNGILSILAVIFIKVWTSCQQNNLLSILHTFQTSSHKLLIYI